MKIQLFFVFLLISLIFAAAPNKPVANTVSNPKSPVPVANSVVDVCSQVSKDACFLFKDACSVKNNKCTYDGPLVAVATQSNVQSKPKLPPIRDICTEIPIFLCLLTKGACYIKNNKCLNPVLCEVLNQC